MNNIIDTIKEKYSEEVGISFTLFELLTFILYTCASYVLFCEEKNSVWGTILTKSIDAILFSDNSFIKKARVSDYIISLILTFVTVFLYKKASSLLYDRLAKIKNVEEYVDRVKNKYNIKNIDNQAMRIYMANAANEEKRMHLKKVTNIKGIGLLSFSIAVSSLLSVFTPNMIDFLALIGGLVMFLFVQWLVFASYTSQVVPRLVLEKLLRNEDVHFNDEL